ncbi:sarcosine oxidase subunit alpha [Dethiosulfatibacter aminovorans DSM 17477]|uniref:Sarcosine oxidase subunit alpha n=1 Tax=Dethiosulfatibacter aminovorans DSM 17477 TaxID=1121476 RepID=A0A1M6IWQ6_9FIRM|nr:FAD-dependent oxidoreductase [Dethiosulfatibacter aminovorans]SHJ38905.1 sarcosine oxidase subunit alpha [Dethiosulfatibacter aminovorans DSM 17477]
MSRINQHPIIDFNKGREVKFTYEGKEVIGCEGETIASALHSAGVRVLHETDTKHRTRGLFCAIGNCSSCLMKVNGVPNVRICVEPLREGMTVEKQSDKEKVELDSNIRTPIDSGEKMVQAEVVIIGGGPAGMCAALEASRYGAKVILVERNYDLGGQLTKQTHKFFGSEKQQAGTRGIDIGVEIQERIMSDPNVEIWFNSTAVGFYKDNTIMVERENAVYGLSGESIIIATGAFEKNLVFPNNDLPGIYGAGAVQTLMNIDGIKPGDDVIMIGAGNIGLIVSYQLIQAGVNVVGVVEAGPDVGGYKVHASKIMRAGVPIYTRHTIKGAHGSDKLEGVTIAEVDDKWQMIQGTEKNIKADVMCMAVGLSPIVELFFQAGCELKFIPALGGYVPVNDEHRNTTVDGLLVAGDSGGVEEASSAMLTGHLAGLTAARRLDYVEDYDDRHCDLMDQLNSLRSGPHGVKIVEGIQRLREGMVTAGGK